MMFNPDRSGLGKVLRDREEQVLRHLWAGPRSTGDLTAETGLRREDVRRILGELHEHGVVDVREDYTMGGRREVWSARFTEADFRRRMVRRVLRSMLDDWPEAREVLLEEAQEMMREAGRRGP